MTDNEFWACPLCGKALSGDTSLRCAGGHCFDRAKEGYIHLLPVQKTRTKNPGDSADMTASRRQFLNAGYYVPFGKTLGELCLAACDDRVPVLLDAGCGEGWYDRQIAEAFDKAGRSLKLYGFDIAKPAVRAAAKAFPRGSYAVASSFHQPVLAESADILINIFSPLAEEEFFRVLRPGGTLIYAVPGPDHLFGLKKVLYREPYLNTVRDEEYRGFRFEGDRTVRGRITVPSEHIGALYAMTPYFWRTPKDGTERLAELSVLETDIEFRFLVFKRLESRE